MSELEETEIDVEEEDAGRDYLFIGEAKVSVALTVRATSLEKAMEKARATMDSEWECDEVDGTVTIIEADGEPVPKTRRNTGIHAPDYVRHVPLDLVTYPEGKTFCGRKVKDVNCIASQAEADASDVCLTCYAGAKRSVAKGRTA